jgi:hypothetical protein
MDSDKVRRLLALDEEKRGHEDRLKEISAERKALESEVLDAFAEAGISNIKVDGKTVSIRHEYWASAKEGQKERACAYLESHGLGVYVSPSFNSLSVSAWLREKIRDNEVPEDFEEFFHVSEVFKVTTRK